MKVTKKTSDDDALKMGNQLIESGKGHFLVAIIGQCIEDPMTTYIECCTANNSLERMEELRDENYSTPFSPSKPFKVTSGITVNVSLRGNMAFSEMKDTFLSAEFIPEVE